MKVNLDSIVVNTEMQVTPLASSEGRSHTASVDDLLIDVYKLIHLSEDLPIQEVLVSTLEAALERKCWTDINGDRISPNDVILAMIETGDLQTSIAQNPELAQHMSQMASADYSHPILIYDGHVIDGVHRLAKAKIELRSTIKARVLGKIPEKALVEK